MILYSYNNNSSSARQLANAIGCKLMKKIKSKYKGDLIINWGSSVTPKLLPHQKILNPPNAVKRAVNKIETFKCLSEKDLPHPPFTEDKEIATGWLAKNRIVLARTVTDFGGLGIKVIQPGMELPDAPLYTQYIKKKKEFRVHVFNGEVIDIKEKRRKKGVPVDNFIRSHSKGWVFCKTNIVEPEGLRELGVNAIAALELDFGAVDIIYNETKNKLFILEINTAPGLESSTLEAYKNAIKNF